MRKYMEVEYKGNMMRGFHDIGGADKVVIVTHGIGGNKLGFKFVFKQFADSCVNSGISTLRFDFVGTGESDGDFADTRHSDQVFQVIEIIKAAKELGYKQIYLCSTTIGCYSIWHAAKQVEGIKGIVNWNPICNFDRYEQNNLKGTNEDGSIDMKGLYLNPTYTRDLGKLERNIPSFDCPVMLLQGELDGEYMHDDARNTAKHNNWNYKVIDGGNHLWEGDQVRKDLFNATTDFVLNN